MKKWERENRNPYPWEYVGNTKFASAEEVKPKKDKKQTTLGGFAKNDE